MLLFIAATNAEAQAPARRGHITGLNDSNVVITARQLTATLAPHSLRSE